MFHQKQYILYLTKSLAHFAVVTLSTHPEIVKTARYQWTTSSLPSLFQTIKQNYSLTMIRVLLDDSLSYLVNLSIPPMPESMERNYISQQLPSLIPEQLTDHEWDFRVDSVEKTGKKITVFAPVHYIYSALMSSSQQSKLFIEAIEPQSLSQKRHNNPIIGLGLKKDIHGKDEQTLNIIIDNSKTNSAHMNKKAGMKRNYIFIALFLFAFTIPLALVLFLSRAQQTPLTPSPAMPDQTLSITPVPTDLTPSPSPIPEETIDLSGVKILVLNGTGKKGASKEVQELLEQTGFTAIDTANAENFDATETTIQLKESVDSSIEELLSKTLSEYSLKSTDLLTSKNNYDVLITVGEKNAAE